MSQLQCAEAVKEISSGRPYSLPLLSGDCVNVTDSLLAQLVQLRV